MTGSLTLEALHRPEDLRREVLAQRRRLDALELPADPLAMAAASPGQRRLGGGGRAACPACGGVIAGRVCGTCARPACVECGG